MLSCLNSSVLDMTFISWGKEILKHYCWSPGFVQLDKQLGIYMAMGQLCWVTRALINSVQN